MGTVRARSHEAQATSCNGNNAERQEAAGFCRRSGAIVPGPTPLHGACNPRVYLLPLFQAYRAEACSAPCAVRFFTHPFRFMYMPSISGERFPEGWAATPAMNS